MIKTFTFLFLGFISIQFAQAQYEAVPVEISEYGLIAMASEANSLETSQTAKQSVQTTALQTDFTQFELEAWPNPFSKSIQLKFNNPDAGMPLEIKVINSIGQVVHLETRTASSSENRSEHTLNLSAQSSGVYFVTVTSGQIKETRRLIKQE
jgi:hypothetical protein